MKRIQGSFYLTYKDGEVIYRPFHNVLRYFRTCDYIPGRKERPIRIDIYAEGFDEDVYKWAMYRIHPTYGDEFFYHGYVQAE